MRAVDIIMKKRDNLELSKEEIDFLIDGYTKGNIEDYQMSAFTMAVFFNGMTDLESTYLALAMLNSGDVLDLSKIEGIKVDKHSTGGVGDKTSLVVAPVVASLGIKFAKMSGRGLGHTGGTLDKLESIPGYNISLKEEEFIEQVNDIGIALIGQTQDLAPADKKLYALRDVTATVESIPLIASSIMSKKLASGADVICLDVKVGSGAFMKNVKDATKLAKLMVQIGKNCNKKMTAVLTNMDEPLGYAVGNNLEIIEAIKFLKGDMPEDVKEVVLELGSYMMKLAGKGDDLEENKRAMLKNIKNGKAYEKFLELVKNQNGDISYIENIENFEKAKLITPVYSNENGYISKINAKEIGKIAGFLGAGREKKEDSIDYSVGIVLNKKVGDKVEKDEVIAYIHSNDVKKMEEAVERVRKTVKISKEIIRENNVILEIIN